MGFSRIARAEWPSTGVPQPVKDLLELFFELLDTNTEDVGKQLATKVFTKDAFFKSFTTTSRGSAGE
jgi:hypothetical protein